MLIRRYATDRLWQISAFGVGTVRRSLTVAKVEVDRPGAAILEFTAARVGDGSERPYRPPETRILAPVT